MQSPGAGLAVTDPLVTAALLGLLLGVQHAADGDHLVAVATIVTRERGFAEGASIGALWGLGHTLTLGVVGGAMQALGVSSRIPTHGLELVVAAMLVTLGVARLREAIRGLVRLPADHLRAEHAGDHDHDGAELVHHHPHVHDGRVHDHLHVHPSRRLLEALSTSWGAATGPPCPPTLGDAPGDPARPSTMRCAATGPPSPPGHRGGTDAVPPSPPHARSRPGKPGTALGNAIRSRAPRFRLRPLLVGAVHGLAGSAAVSLVVLASVESAWGAAAYLALFGFGTIAGMTGFTAAMAYPVSLAARVERARHALGAVAGVGSIAFGLVYGARVLGDG